MLNMSNEKYYMYYVEMINNYVKNVIWIIILNSAITNFMCGNG